MIIPVFALHRTDKFDSAGSVRCAGNYSSAYEAGSIKLQQSVMALFRQCIRLLYATMLWAHDMAKCPRVYSFEAATRDLAADGISNLVFTLDSPVSAVLHASTLEGLGRFFFDRDRQAVSVTAVTLHSGEDASTTLLASAQSPRSGILWLYNLNVHDTIARVSPPHVAELDRHWRCRNYGTDSIGVLACVNTEQLAGAASVR